MELTLKNEHCAVTVTDAGAMLRSLVRDGREYLWQEIGRASCRERV